MRDINIGQGRKCIGGSNLLSLFGQEVMTAKNMNNITIKKFRDFPGGAVVENPPANAGDTGSGPGPGGSHMPRSSWARAPQLLSLRCRAHVPQLLKPVRLEPVPCTKRSHRNEKPMHSNEDAAQPKIINK